MATGFVNIKIFQATPYTLPNATVFVTFDLTGLPPDIVQVYAVQAGSQLANDPGVLPVDAIDWQTPNPEGESHFEVQAGNAYSIYLCPRNKDDATGILDDDYDGTYWETSCVLAGSITTKVPGSPSTQPTKPVIIKVDNELPTLQAFGTITVSWVSSPYDKFLVWWTVNGQSLAQGEVGTGGGATSGTWTTNQAVAPGATYTFKVEGGTGAGPGFGYNWSGWGPTVTVVAAAGLRSLIAFLKHSGINPAGLSVRSIMGGQTSLKHVMKLS